MGLLIATRPSSATPSRCDAAPAPRTSSRAARMASVVRWPSSSLPRDSASSSSAAAPTGSTRSPRRSGPGTPAPGCAPSSLNSPPTGSPPTWPRSPSPSRALTSACSSTTPTTATRTLFQLTTLSYDCSVFCCAQGYDKFRDDGMWMGTGFDISIFQIHSASNRHTRRG